MSCKRELSGGKAAMCMCLGYVARKLRRVEPRRSCLGETADGCIGAVTSPREFGCREARAAGGAVQGALAQGEHGVRMPRVRGTRC